MKSHLLLLLVAVTICTVSSVSSSETFQNKTLNIEIPENFKDEYPYYIAGSDKEGRKVLIVEVQKWNFAKAVEDGTSELLLAHLEKAFDLIRNLTSSHSNETDSATHMEESGVGLIMDMENFALRQLTSLTTVQLLLKVARRLTSISPLIAYNYLINTNFAGHTLLNLVRPILGDAFSTTEVFGTKKSSWLPVLLSKISTDQLPEIYGGAKGFKPESFYG